MLYRSIPQNFGSQKAYYAEIINVTIYSVKLFNQSWPVSDYLTLLELILLKLFAWFISYLHTVPQEIFDQAFRSHGTSH